MPFKLTKTVVVIMLATLAAIFSLLGFVIFNSVQPPINLPPPPPTAIEIPPPLGEGMPCGEQTCHGADLNCGANVVEACTLEFQLMDQCRNYAYCEKVDGVCTTVKEPKFNECVSCLTQCQTKFANDPNQVFTCAESCP